MAIATNSVTTPPWWREIALVVGVYAAYAVTRGVTNGDLTSADSTGYTLLRWEQSWHLAPERTLNQMLGRLPPLAVAASYFYAVLHYVITPAVLVWMYRRHPASYRVARTTLGVATVLGLAGFLLLPTTPPRLLPGGGFHDTLADVSGWGWWGGQASAPRGLGGLTNQYAAMPSLHLGWALWSGWLLARHARRRAIRAAGALYPVLTVIVVMATANHYLLDALAGIADVALAVALAAGIAAGIAAILAWPAHAPPAWRSSQARSRPEGGSWGSWRSTSSRPASPGSSWKAGKAATTGTGRGCGQRWARNHCWPTSGLRAHAQARGTPAVGS